MVVRFASPHGGSHTVVALALFWMDARPGLEISEEDIQIELDRRKPGQSKITTQRKEEDQIEIPLGSF